MDGPSPVATGMLLIGGPIAACSTAALNITCRVETGLGWRQGLLAQPPPPTPVPANRRQWQAPLLRPPARPRRRPRRCSHTAWTGAPPAAEAQHPAFEPRNERAANLRQQTSPPAGGRRGWQAHPWGPSWFPARMQLHMRRRPSSRIQAPGAACRHA
jgi:hypothetical protein